VTTTAWLLLLDQ